MPARNHPTFAQAATLTIAQLERTFHTRVSKGLTSAQILALQEKDGLNVVYSHRVRWWNILARQFHSSFVSLLIVAAILSAALGQLLDAGMIFLFVLINSIIGFYQEYHSEKTVQLLALFVVVHCRVVRDGKEAVIPASQLVRGDLCLLEPGDRIPADVRLVDAQAFIVDESVLSGESGPVAKQEMPLPEATTAVYKAQNIGFAGTTVVGGRGRAVVVATGRETMMGQASTLSVETQRISTFEKGINAFSNFILKMTLLTILCILAAHLLIKGGNTNIVELFIFSIALAVSVIPEALPLVTTFCLSRGALKLARNNVVVKRLSAIEDLGSIDVLCTDKTGTITQNNMRVAEVWSNGRENDRLLFTAAAAGKEGNAFDAALVAKLSASSRKALRYLHRLGGIPFDPLRRRESALVEMKGQRTMIVRGAPEAILEHGKGLSREARTTLQQWIRSQGLHGRRVLAIAQQTPFAGPEEYQAREEEHDLELVGAVSFEDPIKSTTQHAVSKARALGVTVKILTGDSKEVAGAVAKKIGLIADVQDVLTGEELERFEAVAQHRAVERYHVFARVTPQQKYAIIEMLQSKREVGFLGEGINDAPALKKANVALVVESAADISREAADIVLLKKSLDVIVDGIKDGREVFANTMKYIKATLSSNFGNFYAIALASLLTTSLPMLPLQILLVNLLTDFPIISIATDHVDPPELKRPKGYRVKEVAFLATVLGLVSTTFDFIFFGVFRHFSIATLQTNWFIGSVLTELLFLFSIRTQQWAVAGPRPSPAMLILTGVAAAAAVLLPLTSAGQSLFQFTPPSKEHLVIIASIVGMYFLTTDFIKVLFYRFNARLALLE